MKTAPIIAPSDPPEALALSSAAKAFAALGSEQRLIVMQALVRAGPEGLTVGEIGARSKITGSTLTHHVRALTEAGLINQIRAGRSIICAAASFEVINWLNDFLLTQCCADAEPSSGRQDAAPPHTSNGDLP